MIKSKQDALEHCRKYGVDLKSFKSVAVSEDGSIFINTTSFDASDTSLKFFVKGEPNGSPKKTETKKVSKSKLEDGNESKNNI